MKKYFVFALLFVILMAIISFILSGVFENFSGKFAIATGLFGISIIMLFQVKNAEKPIDGFDFGNSPLKRHYNRVGDLKKYREIMTIMVMVVICLGVGIFTIGILEILFVNIFRILGLDFLTH